jgi:hypothetical protein
MCSYSGLLLLVAQMLGNLNPIRLSYWLKASLTGGIALATGFCDGRSNQWLTEVQSKFPD